MDELDTLLGEVRSSYTPDDESRDRVRRAVAGVVAGGAVVGVASVGEASTAGAEAATTALAKSAATGAKLGVAKAGAGGVLSGAAAKWGLVLALAGGGLAFVLGLEAGGPHDAGVISTSSVGKQMTRPPVPLEVEEPVVPSPEVLKEEEPIEAQKTIEVRRSKKVERENSKSKATPAVQESTLRNELSLLREASSELHKGRADRTLEILAEHRRLYPSSVVGTEREGLRILAQCVQGSSPAAAGAAQRFLSKSPNSPLAPHIRKSCLK